MNPYNNNPMDGTSVNPTRPFNPGAGMPAANNAATIGKPSNGNTWAKRGAFAAGGVLLGTAASVALSSINGAVEVTESDEELEGEVLPEAEVEAGVEAEYDYTDGVTTCARGNYDNMSFADAFASVRSEYGPGAVFQWRGGVYGSYTADEWNAMNEAERSEYASHVNWDVVDHDDNYQVSNGHNGQQYAEQPEVPDGPEPITGGVQVLDVTDDPSLGTLVSVDVNGQEALLVDVDKDGVIDYMASDFNSDGQLSEDEVIDVSNEDITMANLGLSGRGAPEEPVAPGIEVDDFYFNEETGAIYASAKIDGTQSVLADVDGDGTFDYLAMDLNGNNQIDDGEITDISGENITFSGLLGDVPDLT